MLLMVLILFIYLNSGSSYSIYIIQIRPFSKRREKQLKREECFLENKKIDFAV